PVLGTRRTPRRPRTPPTPDGGDRLSIPHPRGASRRVRAPTRNGNGCRGSDPRRPRNHPGRRRGGRSRAGSDRRPVHGGGRHRPRLSPGGTGGPGVGGGPLAEAVALTRANAERNGLTVSVVEGDVQGTGLLAELHGTVDVVVSNPPYIPFECEPLEAEVRDYDPPAALYGGGVDGLAIPIAVIHRARALLRPGGTLIIEHGDGQGRAMREHVERQGGFQEIHTQQDLTNRDRMVVAARDQVAH